ncbi:MAG: diaminopimelate decarboxylase [Myxococcales bacterium]|nr:diaminopimelate decarboxylase [Myxococcales bacterium]HIK84691.1 diaminopimelate decarboxylase [Myxococcales bacterium]
MRFLNEAQIVTIRERFGTPVYVYDQGELEAAADQVLAFPAPCKLVGRFAMKSLPTAAVLRLFDARGLHFDASSGFEAERALLAGIEPSHIQITAQELPQDMKGLVQRGVLFNACSLHQLRHYGLLFPGSDISIRVNPGAGSGHNNRTNTGGVASSFGIWHEQLDQAFEVADEFDLRVTGLHTHIGSGGDPEVWKRCAGLVLEIASRFPDLNRLSLGGGFKVARMENETSADLVEIGETIRPLLTAFITDLQQRSGRTGTDAFQIEIEPGSFLVVNAGALLTEIIDIVDTGSDGYSFLKINSGMTEILRPAMYGAQHPLFVVSHGSRPDDERPADPRDAENANYIVAGHCCESSDILTPAPGDPEALAPRPMASARIGDTLVIEGAGAYCAGMSAKNYNSFPEAAEVLITRAGEARLIRRRQTLTQSIENEISTDDTIG